MPPPKAEDYEEPREDWLTTYADAITLLMAFFVMLLTFAEFDIPAYEELSSALAANIGKREQEQTTTQSLKIDVEDIVYNMQADQVVEVSQDDKGVVIELQSNAFFRPASADLVPAAATVLQELAGTLGSNRYELYNVVVEGHTDDGAISTEKFPSNWELSTGRSSSVVRLFENNEVDRLRMTAAGFSDTRPKVPNRDIEGRPIPENRATNRRVVLRLSPMSVEERDAYLLAKELRLAREAAERRERENLPPPVRERLPIQPTPETLTETQRQIKLALDVVIRRLYQANENDALLTQADIDAAAQEVDELSSARDDDLVPFFAAIEEFIAGERERLQGANQTSSPAASSQ